MPHMYGSARATEARGRASDAALQQPDLMALGHSRSVRRILLTRLSLLNQVAQPIVHLIDELAKVAAHAPGTSEARMSKPVWPSVSANSDHCNSKSSSIVDRIPSAGRSRARTSRDES
jgi:hypothetical protein